MWLSDYEMAIAAMRDVFQDACFEVISCSIDGMRFVFQPMRNGDHFYVYFRNSGQIEKHYSDTWRNPSHYEIIKKGKN